MALSLSSDMTVEIEVQATKVRRLAELGENLPLDRMRDETATLQALLAEAASLERRAGF